MEQRYHNKILDSLVMKRSCGGQVESEAIDALFI